MQLEGLIAGLTVLPGISVPEKALSLDHCDGVLRQDVGCDVIDAMEDALVDLWGCWAHVPRSQPVLVFARSWGDDVGKMLPVTQRDHFKEWVGSCGQNEPVATCRECSSALDLSNHSAKCPLTLCMKREEFERPICTDRWQGRIRLRCCENPDDQIRGADAANFAKILYKCYGIIVKDLRDKGFTISMSLQSRCACSNRCGLAAHITIRPIPALLQDDGPLRK